MSSERDLISKILLTRDLSVVTDAGVTPNFFQDTAHRDAFQMITAHQKQYGLVPTIETFRKDYPTYKISEAGETIPYYCDELRRQYALMLLEEGIGEAADAYDDGDFEDSKRALAHTLNLLNEEISSSRVTDLTQTGDKRLERYRTYGKGAALKGISSGFESIDFATGGFQQKQLITMVGPPKAGKSTMMLLAAIAAHASFYRTLFIGFEMSNEEQEERHDALRAHISHKRLREGRLKREEMQALERMTRRLELMPSFPFSEDVTSTLTLSGIAAQIERHKPDIVFVDGVYMMDDEEGERKGSPQALTNITRGFKKMVKNLSIAGCISTQVLGWKMDRKRGVTADSIGYTSSFAQDSDQIIAVEKTDDEMVNKIKVVLGRNNPGMEAFVRWNWETGEFTELEGESGEEHDPETESRF